MHNGIKIIKKAVEGQQKKSEWKIMKINKSKGLDGTVSMVDFSVYGLSQVMYIDIQVLYLIFLKKTFFMS